MRECKDGLYAPAYYNHFKCIADKCRHSCCINWEICIDDDTYAKYKQNDDIILTVAETGDGPCFKLSDNARCPHLNDDGLCNIIINHGEEYLSEICRNHPRFFNDVGERIEAGLGMVCEEACRLILENDAPFALYRINSVDLDTNVADYDALSTRDRIISLIEAEGGYDDRVASIRAEFPIPDPYTPGEWIDRLLSLEILDPAWEHDLRALRGTPHTEHDGDYDKYYKRLLTYFVYRHVSTADSETDLPARLGFAVLSVEMIRYIFEADRERSLERLIDVARRYSAEIEYSPDNTDELIFAFECMINP